MLGVMAGIYTPDDTTETLDTLRGRGRFALARIKSDPNAAPYKAAFTAFGAAWTPIDQKEMDKEDAVTDAEAAAVKADGDLDDLVRKVSTAIFGGKKVDVTLPLADLYFGGLAPSEFMRPQLGKQLQGMIAWPGLLAQATQPALLALAPLATTAVAAADAAAKALHLAVVDRDLFHQGGERKTIFDLYNASAATAWGGLKNFVHSNSALDLPPGYPESFFQPGPTSASQPRTLGEANALVTRLEQKLGKAKTAQSTLVQKEAEHAAALAKHKQALAEEAAAKKAEEAAKKATKTAAEAAKKTKPKKK